MMRTLLTKTLLRLANWLRPKGMPYALAGPQWSGTSFVDSYRRNRQPTPNEILAELKNTAWTCASINAATCANYPPRLYLNIRIFSWTLDHYFLALGRGEEVGGSSYP